MEKPNLHEMLSNVRNLPEIGGTALRAYAANLILRVAELGDNAIADCGGDDGE